MPGNIIGSNTGNIVVNTTGLLVKGWGFVSFVGVSAVTQYVGGFYKFGASNFIPAGGQSLGTANISYAAHAFIVLGTSSADMVVRVTGTSITDSGVRTPADTEDIDTSGGSLNDYYETSKKWLGTVSISLVSGTGINVNYGLAKYWDNNNTDFYLRGFEVVGFCGASDATPQIKVIHHKTTGWTYNVGSTPTPPAPLADLQTCHNTEFQFNLDEHFAWKRANLNETIQGSLSEGLLFSIDINNNKSISFADLNVTYLVA